MFKCCLVFLHAEGCGVPFGVLDELWLAMNYSPAGHEFNANKLDILTPSVLKKIVLSSQCWVFRAKFGPEYEFHKGWITIAVYSSCFLRSFCQRVTMAVAQDPKVSTLVASCTSPCSRLCSTAAPTGLNKVSLTETH